MKRNALLILSLLVTFATSAWAGPRSWQQAKAIARQEAAKMGITISESSTANAKANGQTAQTDATYYVFANDKDKGYVIVSGDDQMPDIVSYSATGTYDAHQLPPAFAAMLRAYDATVRAVQRGDKKALRIVEEAKALRAETMGIAVDPLLGDIQWNQGKPYNNKCPAYDEKGTLSVTGCVATALAQVMAYYKYPNQLQADIPAYTTKTHHFQMPAIPKGVTFDWDNIIPQYIEGNYTAEQADAVANLMLACGCAFEMNYDESSGTFSSHYALTDYFGYDKELVQQVFRDNFTLKQWTDIIDQELQAKRPIMYCGTDRYGGHEFVCDGADGRGLYHINWGWGGICNNFFDISVLDYHSPDNPADDADGYICECNMIIGITPDNGVVDEPLFARAPIFNMGDTPNSITWTKSKRTNEKEEFEADMTATFSGISTKDVTGYFAVAVEKSDSTYDFLMKTTSPATFTSVGEDKTFNFSFSYAFPIGSTKLRYLCSTDGKTWEPCGSYNFIPTLITATETEIKTDASALTIDISLEDAKHLELNKPVTATFKITNNMSEEFDGGMYLHMRSNEEDSTSCIVRAIFASVPADSTVTKKATFTPAIAGDVKLYFIDGKNLVIGQCDCTVADNTTAISAPASSKQATCNVSSGKGCIAIKASEARSVSVYNANGQKVAELHLKGGEEKTLSLQPGIYIADKKKVVVR